MTEKKPMPDIFVATDINKQTSNRATEKKSLPVNILLQSKIPKSMNSLATYFELPKDVMFESQEQSETILLFLRRDFITNVPWIFAALLLLFVPFILMFILGLTQSPFTFLPPHSALVV